MSSAAASSCAHFSTAPTLLRSPLSLLGLHPGTTLMPPRARFPFSGSVQARRAARPLQAGKTNADPAAMVQQSVLPWRPPHPRPVSPGLLCQRAQIGPLPGIPGDTAVRTCVCVTSVLCVLLCLLFVCDKEKKKVGSSRSRVFAPEVAVRIFPSRKQKKRWKHAGQKQGNELSFSYTRAAEVQSPWPA